MNFADRLEPQETVGVFEGISNADYHAGPGVSKSGLDLIAQCPAIYYGRKIDPDRPPEPKRAGQLEGSLVHTLTLEPETFGDHYIVGPTCNRSTKKWKDFVADNPGLEHIQEPQLEVAQRMADSVRSIPDIAQTLKTGWAERSAFWIDPMTGVYCKCRPDFCHPTEQGNILLDLKTYNSADPRECARQIARKRYHVQDAFYSDGHEHATGDKTLAFVFVFVSTEWPHLATPLMLTAEDRQAGRDAYQENLETYRHCNSTGEWPGYVTGVSTVALPSWIHHTQE